jgi:hypothetical protein
LMTLASTYASSLTLDLENYNEWNLPYAKTFHTTINDDTLAALVLPQNFTLEMNFNSYFGVIYTGRPVPDPDNFD